MTKLNINPNPAPLGSQDRAVHITVDSRHEATIDRDVPEVHAVLIYTTKVKNTFGESKSFQNHNAWWLNDGKLGFPAGRLEAVSKCLIDRGYYVSVEDQRADQPQTDCYDQVAESADPNSFLVNDMLDHHLGRLELMDRERMAEIIGLCVNFFAQAKILLIVPLDSAASFIRKSLTENLPQKNRLDRNEIEIVTISRLRNRMPRIWDIVFWIDVEMFIDKDAFTKLSRLKYRRLYSLFCFEPFPDLIAADRAEFLAGQVIFSDRPNRASTTVQSVSTPALERVLEDKRSIAPDNVSRQVKPSSRPKVTVKFHATSSWARIAYAEFFARSIVGEEAYRNCRERRIVTCSASDAVQTLRDCGELGGNLVANLLEIEAVTMDACEVDWDEDTVALRGFIDDRVFLTAGAYYDRLPFVESCPEELRASYNTHVSLNHSSLVHGATPQLAQDASILVTIAAFRLLPSVVGAVAFDQPMGLPVGPNELATILHSDFATKPTAVAEALLALHANAQDTQKWLLDALEEYPKLALLAAEVGKYLVSRDDVPPSLRQHALALIHPDPNHGSSD